jgi:hypothetical protein
MKNRNLIFATTLIVAALCGYWLKNQIGINLFDSASLSRFFPFNRLQRNDVIADPKPGILFEESFDSHKIVRHWGKLWMKEKSKVVRGFDMNGRNDSRCLVIKSTSEKSWALSYDGLVEVKQGDIFGFSGFVKQDGDMPSAYFRVIAFDERRNIVNWYYESEHINNIGKWVFVQKKIAILDDVKYLEFGLVGVGKGEYRFDDLVFQKYGS